LAAIVRAFAESGVKHEYIDSGQHYDAGLSADLVKELRLPNALAVLNPGTGNPVSQISKLMVQLETVIEQYNPKFVLVYGDTNTTLSASIACTKMGIKFAHIEAGLRSFNFEGQEERNRIIVDHSADILFAPTQNAKNNLIQEGLVSRTFLVGDVMVDVLEQGKPYGKPTNFYWDRLAEEDFYVATFHRAENVDNPQQLAHIVTALSKIEQEIILFAHPRLTKQLQNYKIKLPKNVVMLPPAEHSEILKWISHSKGLITDSGGLQKEAFILQIPCTTFRNETEWVETLTDQWNILIPDISSFDHMPDRKPKVTNVNPFGDGQAGKRIVETLTKNFLDMK